MVALFAAPTMTTHL